MPLVETVADNSLRASGFTSSSIFYPYRVPELFTVIRWTGNGAARSISTNNVDLSTFAGGMVWVKNLTTAGTRTIFFDTLTGVGRYYDASTTNVSDPQSITAFGSQTISLGTSTVVNASSSQYIAYIFHVRANFFTLTTYVGNASASRSIAHGLATTPDMCIVSGLGVGQFVQYTTTGTNFGTVNSNTAYPNTASATFMPSAPDGTNITVGNNVNSNGNTTTYVLWAFVGNINVFGPNQNSGMCRIQQIGATAAAVQPLTNNPLPPQFGLSLTSGGAGNLSGWTHQYARNKFGATGADFYSTTTGYGNVTYPCFRWTISTNASTTIVGSALLAAGSSTGGIFGWLQPSTPTTSTLNMTVAHDWEMLAPNQTSIAQYVVTSGTTGTFSLQFNWEGALVHCDTFIDSFAWPINTLAIYLPYSFNTIDTITATAAIKSNIGTLATNLSGPFNSVDATANNTTNRVIFFKSYYSYSMLFSFKANNAALTLNHGLGRQPTFILAHSFGATATTYQAWFAFPVLGIDGAVSSTTNSRAAATSFYSPAATSTQISLASTITTPMGTTYGITGFMFADKVNLIATGTYVGTGVAQTITLSGWSVVPSLGFIFSDITTGTQKTPLVIGSLGASQSTTWRLFFNGFDTASTTDTQVIQYSSSPNFGFQVSAAGNVNTNGSNFYYVFFR